MALDVLTEAIRDRRVIRYRYSKPDEPPGYRTGHPYAVFIYTDTKGIVSTKVHIVQTDGVSKSNKPFPSFRTHNLDGISEVKILDELFGEPYHQDYNPEWEKYIDVIIKI